MITKAFQKSRKEFWNIAHDHVHGQNNALLNGIDRVAHLLKKQDEMLRCVGDFIFMI